ncbi:MAG: fatty acid desaturase, partial [Bacteroidota bacterium]
MVDLHDPHLSTVDARRAMQAALGDALTPLRRLDDRRRLLDLAVFGGLWAASIALVVLSRDASGPLLWASRAVSVLGSALALNAFVLLLHEGMHGTLFRASGVNRWVSVGLGATVLMSFTAYQVLHSLHHDELGNDDDPDDYHALTGDTGRFFLLQWLRLTVGTFIYLLAIPVTAANRGTPKDRRRMLQEYPLVIAGVGLAFVFAPADVLVWAWAAALPVVAAMVQIRGLTQHGLTERDDALLASRTVRPHPVVAFFLLHENLHLEHHLFPEVPSYHLPELHRLVWARLPRAVEGTS